MFGLTKQNNKNQIKNNISNEDQVNISDIINKAPIYTMQDDLKNPHTSYNAMLYEKEERRLPINKQILSQKQNNNPLTEDRKSVV